MPSLKSILMHWTKPAVAVLAVASLALQGIVLAPIIGLQLAEKPARHGKVAEEADFIQGRVLMLVVNLRIDRPWRQRHMRGEIHRCEAVTRADGKLLADQLADADKHVLLLKRLRLGQIRNARRNYRGGITPRANQLIAP